MQDFLHVAPIRDDAKDAQYLCPALGWRHRNHEASTANQSTLALCGNKEYNRYLFADTRLCLYQSNSSDRFRNLLQSVVALLHPPKYHRGQKSAELIICGFLLA